MIKAWVFYYNSFEDTYHFEELDGIGFDKMHPNNWGLPAKAKVLLVLQKAQFLGAWVEGNKVKP